MSLWGRYLVRNVFVGFGAAAALLIPLFTTFDLISELDNVSAGGYRWTQAVAVVLMTLPRRLIDLGPFIALLGGIVGLGQLAVSQEAHGPARRWCVHRAYCPGGRHRRRAADRQPGSTGRMGGLTIAAARPADAQRRHHQFR